MAAPPPATSQHDMRTGSFPRQATFHNITDADLFIGAREQEGADLLIEHLTTRAERHFMISARASARAYRAWRRAHYARIYRRCGDARGGCALVRRAEFGRPPSERRGEDGAAPRWTRRRGGGAYARDYHRRQSPEART